MKNNNPGDLVTDLDKSIETLIRKLIRKNFPAHKIVGEEFTPDLLKKNDFVWTIDPIDGTTNYVQGIPFCCISIGLWDKQGPLAAVVFNPILKQTYTAIRGQGARLNEKKISVSKAKSLASAMGTIGWGKAKLEAKTIFGKIIGHCFKLRIFATGTWQICMVASGNTDFYASISENLWDFGAAVLFVKEAGGKVTDLQGKAINLKTRSIVASNGKIHNELIRTVR